MYGSARMECRFVKVALGALALVASLVAQPCAADPNAAPAKPAAAPSLWKDAWPQFSTTEAVLTLTSGLGTIALAFVPPASEPRWEGPVLFDSALRDALRAESAERRRSIRAIGDKSYYAAPVLPLLVDAFVVSLLVRGDKRAAANLALISAEAFSYTGLVTFVALRGAARQRPDASECKRSSPDPSRCTNDTESFLSGHTSVAATSAGLVCANHLRMPLWGHPVADASACGLAISMALFTGTSRMIADRHYASDVLAGLTLGLGVGYAVPVLLHYSRTTRQELALTADPTCGGACLALRGAF
jgi:membrane-associated phospholipid phosphatase